MTERTLSFRGTVVCPEDVRIEDNVRNAIATRDVETETIIETDNVHICTEIYSRTHLAVSSEMNDESRGMPCPDFEHDEEHYMILHSSRSKCIGTDSPDIDEDTVPIKCESFVESKYKQVTKIQAVDAPSDGPQKDSWDEGSRLLSETGKILEIRKKLCHPDCPNLRISRATQLQQVSEAGTSFEVCDTLAVTRTDKMSMTVCINEEDTAEKILATILEEESVCSTTVSVQTQCVRDVADVAEDQLVQDDEKYDLTICPSTIEDVEYSERGTVVPTESILETSISASKIEKQKKLRSKWESTAWIISPPPTRFDEAETRSCAKLIRLSSSQLHRCETRCASNIRCAASSNLGYDEDCPVVCSSKTSSTYCRPQEPFTCDRLRAINNAKNCSIARNSACNRYNSNFNIACRVSNNCWYPLDHASHSTYMSQYIARNCYTTAYCYSSNTWH